VVAADSNGLLGEPLKERGAVGNLTRCFGEGLAHLGGHDGGQPVGIGSDQIEGAPQDVCALARGRFAPRGLCTAGSLDGVERIVSPTVGDLGNDFVRCRVFHDEGGSARGFSPATVDEQVGVEGAQVKGRVHVNLSVIEGGFRWSGGQIAAVATRGYGEAVRFFSACANLVKPLWISSLLTLSAGMMRMTLPYGPHVRSRSSASIAAC
jgi:hypothetical protein